MDTLVIHIENPSHTQKIKDFLKTLNVKVEVYAKQHIVEEELPTYVINLMEKSLAEADQKSFTANEEFLLSVKSKYSK
jgi:hypothetical protein